MKQIENAANIVDVKYDMDNYTVVWLFDQSSCRRKFDEKALVAKNILVKDGGPRRMRDTVWANKPQKMVTDEGVADDTTRRGD